MNMYILSKAGINVAEGVNRFNGNEALYEKFLMRFPEDANYQALREGIEKQDVKAAFAAGHALKGIAGNLSISKLFEDIYPLVEELRSGSLENAESLFAPVREDYDRIVEVLKQQGA